MSLTCIGAHVDRVRRRSCVSAEKKKLVGEQQGNQIERPILHWCTAYRNKRRTQFDKDKCGAPCTKNKGQQASFHNLRHNVPPPSPPPTHQLPVSLRCVFYHKDSREVNACSLGRVSWCAVTTRAKCCQNKKQEAKRTVIPPKRTLISQPRGVISPARDKLLSHSTACLITGFQVGFTSLVYVCCIATTQNADKRQAKRTAIRKMTHSQLCGVMSRPRTRLMSRVAACDIRRVWDYGQGTQGQERLTRVVHVVEQERKMSSFTVDYPRDHFQFGIVMFLADMIHA